MAKPSEQTIENFMSITGETESVAIQTLEEHAWDLNDALFAYFREGDRTIASRWTANGISSATCQDNSVNVDNPIQDTPLGSPSSHLSSVPFSIPDVDFSAGLSHGASDSGDRPPVVTHPREVRQIPVEVKHDNETSDQSRDAPTNEDVKDTMVSHGPDVLGTVIIDDVDVTAGPAGNPSPQNEDRSFDEMIQAAIEASKREAEEEAIRAAIEASEKEAEEEAIRAAIEASKKETGAAIEASKEAEGEKELNSPKQMEKVAASNSSRTGSGRSSITEDDVEEQTLVRTRSKSSALLEAKIHEVSPPSSPRPDSVENHPQHSSNPIQSDEHSSNPIQSDEWGGSDFKIHEVSQPSSPRPVSEENHPQHNSNPLQSDEDDGYLASLKADQEKELREAAALGAQEEAASKAVLEAERQREEERCRQLKEEKLELETQLAPKEASLPLEPPEDDEN